MSMTGAQTRIRRRAAGLCGECGAECSESCCSACKRKSCERHKRLRLRRRSQGLCVDCGKSEPCYPLTRCLACRDLHLQRDAACERGNHRRRKQRQDRKAAGLCAVCGRQPHLPDMTKCLDCKVRIGLREQRRREGMV